MWGGGDGYKPRALSPPETDGTGSAAVASTPETANNHNNVLCNIM